VGAAAEAADVGVVVADMRRRSFGRFTIVGAILLSAVTLPARQAAPLRVALVRQPFVPNGTSVGPTTMAEGGIQDALRAMGADVRVQDIGLTPEQEPEYGGWKRLGYALGHLGRTVAANEREGWFTVGLLATCPSMPGMVAGFQHSGSTGTPLTIGLLWLDAHPDYNTPDTTRSGSLGGMPVAVATGLCLRNMRLDAGLDPPLSDVARSGRAVDRRPQSDGPRRGPWT